MRGGSGALVILLYALYGAFVSSLYIQFGDKGAVRSADFLFFVIVAVLLTAGNLGSTLIRKTAMPLQRRILLVLFLYIVFRSAASVSSPQLHFGVLITEVALNFLVGFIAFTELRLGLPILWRLLASGDVRARARQVAAVATAGYITANVYFLVQFSGSSVSDLGSLLDFVPLSNDYYQDFGDFMIVAYCCLVALQLTYLRLSAPSRARFLMFLVVLAVQAGISFLALQAVNSNKSVVAIGLVTVFAVYVGKARGWPKSGPLMSVRTALGTALALAAVAAVYVKLSPEMDLSRLRIFDYGESSSLLENSSLVARWEQLVGDGVVHLRKGPIFGDPTLPGYVHSALVSLQTHLGLVGGLLFWPYVAGKLRDVARSTGADALKSIAVPILFVAIISSFITWGPLWFLVGGLYAYVPDPPELRLPERPSPVAPLAV